MFSERDHRPDGEVPPENRRAAERHALREMEERVRFQNQLREVGKPYDAPEGRVLLRPESETAIRDDASSFRVQSGKKDVGWLYLEHDQKERSTTIVDFKIVDAQDRGRGIGTEALRQAESHARDRGMREIHGELSKVDTDEGKEEPARARERNANFYRRNGYEVSLIDDEKQPIFGYIRKEL